MTFAIAVALVAGSGTGTAANPKPALRYWHVTRVDANPRPIDATVTTTVETRESVAYVWVVERTGARRTAFDIGGVFGYGLWPTVSGGSGHGSRAAPTPRSATAT